MEELLTQEREEEKLLFLFLGRLIISSPQLQHQSSTSMLVDLSLLNNQQHQGGVVSTGLGLSFEDQQQQQKLQQQQLGLLFPSPVLSSLASDISAQIKQQRDEINQLLQTQGVQYLGYNGIFSGFRWKPSYS